MVTEKSHGIKAINLKRNIKIIANLIPTHKFHWI